MTTFIYYFKKLLCYLLDMSNLFHHHSSSTNHLLEVRHTSTIGKSLWLTWTYMSAPAENGC